MFKKLLVYMPAFNEVETIGSVLESVPNTFDGFESVELLVVDDGSTDNTAEAALLSGAHVIKHTFNKGVGSAFQTAVNYSLDSQVDILVSIDADGQFDVNEIQNMVAPILKQEADFCIGNRFSNQRPANMPILKYWGNMQINKIVSSISKTKIKDASCGFRAYSLPCLLNLNLHGDFTYTHEVILDLITKGFQVVQVPIGVTYFDDRKSRVANNLFSYALKTSKIIIKSLRDYKPFYFFGAIAFSFFLVSFFIGIFVLIHWIATGGITPYKSFGIFSLVLFLISILFFVLAFLADMLGRIRYNQEKMLYLIKRNHFGKN